MENQNSKNFKVSHRNRNKKRDANLKWSSAKNNRSKFSINYDDPKLADIRQTQQLILHMQNVVGLYETVAAERLRLRTVNELDQLLKKWLRHLANANGQVRAFGSTSLGVQQHGADIDALCICPMVTNRSLFFTEFFTTLKAHPSVTDAVAIPDAFVPIIKLKMNGIDVDLLFARLNRQTIVDDMDLSDDLLLHNLSAKCIRSLNGVRVTDEILRSVPDVCNFQIVLRAVKLWAKRNGCYSNSLGYLGGVSWALMVAKVCRLNPYAAASTILLRFFEFYVDWSWPCPLLQVAQKSDVLMASSTWNCTDNGNDLMPIITPVYPQQNSTFNVTKSSRAVIVRQLTKGLTTIRKVMNGGGSFGWDRFFCVEQFQMLYKHYVAVFATAESKAEHLQWTGLVESQIRHFVPQLEQSVRLAQVHTDRTELAQSSRGKSGISARYCSMWMIGLQQFDDTRTVDTAELNVAANRFAEKVSAFASKVGCPQNGVHGRYIFRDNC